MENQPKFLIMGSYDNIDKVLNKLPNKKKLYSNYLYNIEEPFIEYGFHLHKYDNHGEDYNGDFRVIVCPENMNKYNDDLFKNDYFDNITGLILCHSDIDNYDYNKYKYVLNSNDVIHIWFDKMVNNNLYNIFSDTSRDIHYLFNDINWINRIYYYLDTPFIPSNNYCQII